MPGNVVNFLYSSFKELKEGKTTDIYFLRTLKILKNEGLSDVEVHAEFTVSSMPYKWAILGGLRDVAKLLEGLPINVDAFPEGSVFFKKDYYGVKIPIMTITGPYGSFLIYETPILGFLAKGSGVATKAARIKKLAKDKIVLSFGARRTHPAISPFVGYYAYIGGCDGVSCVKAAEMLGIKPSGTMPHSLIILFKVFRGSQVEAWVSFDKHVEKDVPRIALVDTFYDEKIEAVMAAETLKEKLFGIRLDTPSSRRGDFASIIREVRWELDIRGYRNVKIFVSGGIDEDDIIALKNAGADGFGVGSAIANAPIVDIAMDIVAVKKDGEWIPIAKRGKFAGRKTVYRCSKCMIDVVVKEGEKPPKCPVCGGEMEKILKPLIRNGKIVYDFPSPQEERKYVLSQIERLSLT